MEYIFVFQNMLTWKAESSYLKNEKVKLFSIKGGVEIKDITGITVDTNFDNESNIFTVTVFAGSFSVYFKTPNMSEADSLYDILFSERFGMLFSEVLDLPAQVLRPI